MDYENNFIVFPDRKTIVGAAYKHHLKEPAIEDITSSQQENTEMGFGGQEGSIKTFFVHPQLNMLFVAGDFAQVAQYDLSPGRSRLKMVKLFRIQGMAHFWASARFGNLAVFGDCDYHFVFVDLLSRKVIGSKVKTAIQYICSLKFCRVSDSRILLCVTGEHPHYGNSETDVFDVSLFLKANGVGI